MALKPCQGCGRQLDTSAAACPGCGRPEPTGKRGRALNFVVTGAAMLFGFAVWVAVCSGDDKPASSAKPSAPAPSLTGLLEGHINRQVVDDTVAQYEIAKRSGSKMDACVHAGMVSAAYVQAKDEAGYQKAKATEKADCRRAGVPE